MRLMSLTTEDIEQIRQLLRSEVKPIVRAQVENVFETRGREIVREEIDIQLQPLSGKLEAIENDVKELYAISDRLRGEVRQGFKRVNKKLGNLYKRLYKLEDYSGFLV